MDWYAIYCEIAQALPSDSRFHVDVFYTHTSINLILETLAVIRRQEFQRLHNESVPISILASCVVMPSAKYPELVKASDYQPYRHLVETEDDKPQYSSDTLDHLQLALRTGIAPTWLGSIISDAIKNREIIRGFTPLCFTSPNFVGVGPYLKSKTIGFHAVFTGLEPPPPTLTLYLQAKWRDHDLVLRPWGAIQIPPEYQQPDLVIQEVEFDYQSDNPDYWKIR